MVFPFSFFLLIVVDKRFPHLLVSVCSSHAQGKMFEATLHKPILVLTKDKACLQILIPQIQEGDVGWFGPLSNTICLHLLNVGFGLRVARLLYIVELQLLSITMANAELCDVS